MTAKIGPGCGKLNGNIVDNAAYFFCEPEKCERRKCWVVEKATPRLRGHAAAGRGSLDAGSHNLDFALLDLSLYSERRHSLSQQ